MERGLSEGRHIRECKRKHRQLEAKRRHKHIRGLLIHDL
jgi:hypothetical protein